MNLRIGIQKLHFDVKSDKIMQKRQRKNNHFFATYLIQAKVASLTNIDNFFLA